MEAAIRALPKVELHAHLHGCIRLTTLSELLQAKGLPPCPPHWKTMTDAFQIFALTHSVVTEPSVVYRITKEVIEDFAADGVVYLELRTVETKQTPRETPAMTKEDYMQAVLRAVQEAPSSIIVRLILSVNRALGLEAAHQSLSLTSLSPLIVGLDFSGNPSISSFEVYLPIFQSARARGLKTTVHTAEVPNPSELSSILSFRPDRIGHCCCLDPTNEATLLSNPIPMEVCLSSNIGTLELDSLTGHHFQRFYEAGFPMVLCTDDTAVFQTSLTQEYSLLGKDLGMDLEDIKRLVKNSVEFIFEKSQEVREKLEPIFGRI